MAQRRFFDPETGDLIGEENDLLAGEEISADEPVAPVIERGNVEARFSERAFSRQGTGAAGGQTVRQSVTRSPALRQAGGQDPDSGYTGSDFETYGMTESQYKLAGMMGMGFKDAARSLATGPSEIPKDIKEALPQFGKWSGHLGGSASNKAFEKSLANMAKSDHPLAAKAGLVGQIFQPGEFHNRYGMLNSGNTKQQPKMDMFRVMNRINELDPTAVERLMQDDEFTDPRVQGGISSMGGKMFRANAQDPSLKGYMENGAFNTSHFRQNMKDRGRASSLFGSPTASSITKKAVQMAPLIMTSMFPGGAAAAAAMAAAQYGTQHDKTAQGWLMNVGPSIALAGAQIAGGLGGIQTGMKGGQTAAHSANASRQFAETGRVLATGMQGGQTAAHAANAARLASNAGQAYSAGSAISAGGGVGSGGSSGLASLSDAYDYAKGIAQSPAGKAIRKGGKIGRELYGQASAERVMVEQAIQGGQEAAHELARGRAAAQQQASGLESMLAQQRSSLFQTNPYYNPIQDDIFNTAQAGVV
jgi:hypothetical protein